VRNQRVLVGGGWGVFFWCGIFKKSGRKSSSKKKKGTGDQINEQKGEE